MSTWSPELSFIPNRAPYEIVNFKAGQKIVDKINRDLADMEKKTTIAMIAKLDPFHLDPNEAKAISWSIEICPIHSFDICWLNQSDIDANGYSSWSIFKIVLDWLFLRMKKEYGMVPSVSRKRGDTETRWPGAGCHIHVGADLFGIGPDYYQNMERFHRNLTISYANHPELRWLFADWMSCNAHKTLYDPTKKLDRIDGESIEDALFRKMLVGSVHAIEPRFMVTSKNSYLTFEFRFFRMVESAEELCLIVRFVEAWVNHLVTKTLMGETVKPNITKRRWAELKTVTGSKKYIKNFLDEIGLDWQDYEMFYNRNYRTRMKFGSMI